MQQVVVTTLVEHEPKSFNGQNGPWTLHLFKAIDGTRFQTSKTQIANQVFALLNQQVTLTFKQEQRGQYTNNVIEAVAAGATGAQVSSPAASPAAPTAPVAPTAASGGGGGSRGSRAEFQRSKEEMRLTAAMEIAATLFASGVAGTSYPEFQKLAAKIYSELSNASGLAQGSPVGQQAATAPTPPGDGGGGQGAASAAPTAPAAAPAGPSDDIPF